MNQISVTTYCTCKFEPISLYLRVSFYEASYYKSSVNADSDLFMIISKISFKEAIAYIKREIRKYRIKGVILNESKNKLEYSIQGDIALNFDKLKRSIQSINQV